jgi:hypothetical protein
MNWITCVTTLLAWVVSLLLIAPVQAQVAPVPLPSATAPGAAVGLGGELDARTHQMSERVRELGESISATLGNTPAGAVLLRDARELAQAVDEFHQALRSNLDALRRRQLYSGVDASWHHLLGRLGRTGVSAPAVDAAAKRVAEADAQLHQALGLNAYPAIYYGERASPGGMREIQRLARSLVDRAESLLVFVRADMRGPVGSRLTEEVTSLVRSADIFHDGIDLNARPDDLARNGFAGVEAASNTLAADMTGIQPSDRVRAAWQSYRTTERLLRQSLKLPAREDGSPNAGVGGQDSILALADRLIAQADEFLSVFTREVRNVPEGGYFIADVRRLRGAAAEFRAVIPRAIDANQLAPGFSEVDALWEVLARRTNRIAQGRTGANVQRIEGIGQTVAEIHRMLGMPGVSAVVGPFGG